MDELHEMQVEDAIDYIESLGYEGVAEMMDEIEQAIREEL